VTQSFREKYGAVGVVAGASEGLGAAFADSLARRGMDLVLVARRKDALDEVAAAVRKTHGVRVDAVAVDVASDAFAPAVTDAVAGRDVGVGVYNAALSMIGPHFDQRIEDVLQVVDVNVRAPLRFAHALVPGMRARKRGGLVLMSSLAGFQGVPRIATYAATKAFTTVLGESLWAELKDEGVDVVVAAAGAIKTPNYARIKTTPDYPVGTLDPRDVAEAALGGLGRGPVVVPGSMNQLARTLLGRLLPRTSAIAIMERSTRELKGP
jgi:short-subunit dehydrogenase